MLIMKNKLLKTAGILLMTAMTLTQAEASSTKAAAVTETAAGKAEVSGDKQINAMSLAEKNCMAILGLRLGDTCRKMRFWYLWRILPRQQKVSTVTLRIVPEDFWVILSIRA